MSNTFFSDLNYTLANEDTRFEMSVIRPNLRHALSVAGSGARVLPLFASKPQKMTCVDLSSQQLLLTELRIESCRTLSLEDYLSFWGYPPMPENPKLRRDLFLQLNLSDECRRSFFALFESNNWNSILYAGKWERTFKRISGICQSVLGDVVHEMFETEDFGQHLVYMEMQFPHLKWLFLVLLIGNSSFFNALLYKGSFPQKNVKESHFSYYRTAYQRIFDRFLPRDNFFLQMTLLGELKHESGNPIECTRTVFDAVKAGIQSAEIEYTQGNIVEIIEKRIQIPIDFVSLSDVPSYFDNDTAQRFLVRLSHGLADGAHVVARYYLREIRDALLGGFVDDSTQYADAFATEMTQMYRMSVFRKI